MSEQGSINMGEFKTVVEHFEENQKKMAEVMLYEFKNAGEERQSLKEQVALLHEGQTMIRSELRLKPGFEVIEELEKRVTRLENKVA
ncbi:hypothetical protein K8S19_03065 [bacterium]|nr:hypothetical protein [bacterium]